MRVCLIHFVVGIVERQNGDGSFSGDEFGEIDTRFSYCAIAALVLLKGSNLWSLINCSLAKEYILACQNCDGGFSAIPGGESHSGQGRALLTIVFSIMACFSVLLCGCFGFIVGSG